MMFRGPCAACGRDAGDKVRGAVEVAPGDRDGHYEWICLTCARRLAGMLLNAVDKCQKHIANGLDFRYERWQPKAKKRK